MDRIPIPEQEAHAGSFYEPPEDSPELTYMQARRKELGGYMPLRDIPPSHFQAPSLEYFSESLTGSRLTDTSVVVVFVPATSTTVRIGKAVRSR